MKRVLLSVAVLLAPVFAWAEDFTLADGTRHANVTVSRVEPDGLVVTTDSGIVKLPFAKLPLETQKKYSYDPEQAAQFAQALANETRKRQVAKVNAVLDRVATHEAEKLGQGGVEVHGFVVRSFKGDAPVEGSLLVTREYALRGDGKTDIHVATLIFIEGLTNLADREAFHGAIYPTGRVLREDGSAYRAYAISPAIAYGRIREKGEKTVEQVVSEDRARWATR